MDGMRFCLSEDGATWTSTGYSTGPAHSFGQAPFLLASKGSDPFSATKCVRVKKRFLRRELRQIPAV